MEPSRTYRRPESVLVVVYTAGGDVLLLRRRSPLEFWQSVTGSLEPGESHAAAAPRELAEETGLGDEGELVYSGKHRRFEIDPRWRDRYPPGVTTNDEYEYRYRLDGLPEIRIDISEHAGYCWAPIDEAIEMAWSWTNREALEDLRSDL